jgi:hypothetical protein
MVKQTPPPVANTQQPPHPPPPVNQTVVEIVFALFTTVYYAVVLPALVEFQRLLFNFWDILIAWQRYLVELAKHYLWPWVEEFLLMINFESLKLLYNDVSRGIDPDKCVKDYVARARSPFEYTFMIAVSSAIIIMTIYAIIYPTEKYLVEALAFRNFKEAYPHAFRFCVYIGLGLGVYGTYITFAYILYMVNTFARHF